MADAYTIQFRRGMYADFDTSKIRPGEPVAILGNDPSVPSGKALYIAFAANDVRRLCSIEDISEMVNAGEFVGPQGPKGEKGDKGDPGEKGADGTVAFESLTPEQKESLRGISIKSASIDTDGNLTITFSDGGSEDVGNIMGPQGIPGSKGDKGVGIKKITDYYALSSSNTDKAFGQVWLTTPPTMTAEKKYLWHWQRTDYTDGSFYSTEKGVIGVYGEQGPKGDKGGVGPKGDNMSDEQAAQIEQNKKDVASLKTETCSLKEDISNKITKFYASSQGETHLADSDDGKIMDMMLYGKSEQKQYSGKNLFKATLQTTTLNGITCTANSDGTYILNGTCTVSTPLAKIGIFDHILNEPLYLTGVPSGCGSYLALARYDGDNILVTDGQNAKINAGIHTKHIEFWITEGTTLNNVIFKPMITTDLTATYDDFEPYTGGIPSPNPDYPQEIKSVVNPTVKIIGKNLLNATLQTATQNGVTCTNNGDGTYTLNGKLSSNTTFTLFSGSLSIDNKSKIILMKNDTFADLGIVASYCAFKISSSWDDAINYPTIKEIPSGKIVQTINLILRLSNGGAPVTLTNILIKPMIVDASLYPDATYDDFEPYHEQTVTLPYTLNAIPVSSGGNVTIDGQQYMSDYVDVERGKLVRMAGKLTITKAKVPGDAQWYDAEKSYSYEVGSWDIIPTVKKICISDHLTGYYFNDLYKKGIETGMLTGFEYTVVNISKRFNVCTTIDEFMTWFNKSNVIGIFETPIEIDLTPEEVRTFKALVTYYPTTNISINSEQLDGYTIFNYPISMQNGWNYVKQQIGDTRDYIYDMDARAQDTDTQSAEAYVNSEYAVALTELEV